MSKQKAEAKLMPTQSRFQSMSRSQSGASHNIPYSLNQSRIKQAMKRTIEELNKTQENENEITDTNEKGDSRMSEYQIMRARNIERNNAKLREIGLMSEEEEKRSNAIAWGRLISDDKDTNSSICQSGQTQVANNKKKKKRVSSSAETDSQEQPRTRRSSSRLKKLEKQEQENSQASTTTTTTTSTTNFEEFDKKQKELTLQKAAKIISDTPDEMIEAANKNRTATYEHCLMRVRTMTPKALLKRIQTIERACGKHCVVKMAIFKSCLQEEGMMELAEKATEALERLKALQPPPKSFDI